MKNTLSPSWHFGDNKVRHREQSVVFVAAMPTEIRNCLLLHVEPWEKIGLSSPFPFLTFHAVSWCSSLPSFPNGGG